MQIKSLPSGERPLEKAVQHGIRTLSDTELLALILNSGTKNVSAIGVAEAVLAGLEDGFHGLGSASFEDLLGISGIGIMKAGRVLASVELGKRLASGGPIHRVSAGDPEETAAYFMETLRHEKKEHFLTVLVNAKNELITYEEVSVGELSCTVVHPREAFRLAVRRSAAGVIFIHNHPSGDPAPSAQDLRLTERLEGAGAVLGIPVYDHIIIGDGVYTSLRRMGAFGGPAFADEENRT